MKINAILFSYFKYFVLAHLLFSCMEKLESEVLIHNSQFSDLDFSGIDNVQWFEFEGDTLIGPFHNETVNFSLDELPTHNIIRVTIELLVHDSWDGNTVNEGGPDYWFFQVDGQEVFRTTFSNSVCGSLYCLYQSYPENYIRQFEPKTDAVQTNLPGRCQYMDVSNFSTRYEINKLLYHNKNSINISIGDQLKQENTSDPKCDESWSLSKISLHAVVTN